jgi:hypothetical protein
VRSLLREPPFPRQSRPQAFEQSVERRSAGQARQDERRRRVQGGCGRQARGGLFRSSSGRSSR